LRSASDPNSNFALVHSAIFPAFSNFSFEYNTDVVAGNLYEFKYHASNSLGDGEFSKPIQFKATKLPDATKAPNIIYDGTDFIVDWSDIFNDYGSPITKYKILFRDIADVYI